MSRLVVLMGARTGTLDQIGGAKKLCNRREQNVMGWRAMYIRKLVQSGMIILTSDSIRRYAYAVLIGQIRWGWWWWWGANHRALNHIIGIMVTGQPAMLWSLVMTWQPASRSRVQIVDSNIPDYRGVCWPRRVACIMVLPITCLVTFIVAPQIHSILESDAMASIVHVLPAPVSFVSHTVASGFRLYLPYRLLNTFSSFKEVRAEPRICCSPSFAMAILDPIVAVALSPQHAFRSSMYSRHVVKAPWNRFTSIAPRSPGSQKVNTPQQYCVHWFFLHHGPMQGTSNGPILTGEAPGSMVNNYKNRFFLPPDGSGSCRHMPELNKPRKEFYDKMKDLSLLMGFLFSSRETDPRSRAFRGPVPANCRLDMTPARPPNRVSIGDHHHRRTTTDMYRTRRHPKSGLVTGGTANSNMMYIIAPHSPGSCINCTDRLSLRYLSAWDPTAEGYILEWKNLTGVREELATVALLPLPAFIVPLIHVRTYLRFPKARAHESLYAQ
ncbi:hypothetical protein F5J12DRAFT_928093 [Pisolithus orientalis]|uniref:uncharacterized protein n=1 Tax=Pisolithus orientalis TaxID=936130 RepID=UPI0022245026|nr:uncharacterized protein F5J12DRAFT_928093 [Pisolithus orientalis]KAI6003301.1 hypothetical protein F5J12DRAFT_928093 [Pisolithus orientalis]